MNLVQYLQDKGAKHIDGPDAPHLQLSISKKKGDRFESFIFVYDDEPKKIYVVRLKTSGLRFITHDDVLSNHNNLHTIFKYSYDMLIIELKKNGITFTLNNE